MNKVVSRLQLFLAIVLLLASVAISVDVEVTSSYSHPGGSVTSSTLNVFPTNNIPDSSRVVTFSTTTEVNANGIVRFYGVSLKPSTSGTTFVVKSNGVLVLDNIFILSETTSQILISCEENAKVVLSNSTIVSSNFNGNLISVTGSCNLQIVKTTVDKTSFGSLRGISCSSSSNGNILIDSSNFTNVTGNALIYLSQSTINLTILNSLIQGNTFTNFGPVMSLDTLSALTVSITGSSIHQNKGSRAGFIYIDKSTSYLTIDSSIFNSNVANTMGLVSFIDVSVGSISISGSSFTGNTGASGTITYLSNSAMPVHMTTSSFTNNVATSSGCIFMSQTKFDRSIFLKDLTIIGCQQSNYGTFYFAGTSNTYLNVSSISVQNVIMRNSTFRYGGLISLIFVNVINITAHDSQFLNNVGTSTQTTGWATIQSSLVTNFESRNCSFSNNNLKYGGVGLFIKSTDINNLLVESWFSQSNTCTDYGGTIMLTQSNIILAIFRNSTFNRNFARYGTAAYIELGKYNLVFENNNIIRQDSSSISGDFEIYSSNTATLSIINSLFDSGSRCVVQTGGVANFNFEGNTVTGYTTNSSIFRLNSILATTSFKNNKIISNRIPVSGSLFIFETVLQYNTTIRLENNIFENNTVTKSMMYFKQGFSFEDVNNFYNSNESPSSIFYLEDAKNTLVQGTKFNGNRGTLIAAVSSTKVILDSIEVYNSSNTYSYSTGDYNSVIEVIGYSGDLKIQNSFFSQNTIKTGTLFKAGLTPQGIFTISNSTIEKNNGYLLYTIGKTLLTNCNISRNMVQDDVDDRGLFEADGQFKVDAIGCRFSENEGDFLFYGRSTGNTDISSSIFENNKFKSILNVQTGYYTLTNSEISQNGYKATGPCIEVGTLGSLLMLQSSMKKCSSTRVGGISSEGVVYIWNSTISESYGDLNSALQVRGEFEVVDSKILSSESSIGSAIFFGINSFGVIKSSIISSSVSTSGSSSLKIADLAKVDITDTIIDNGQSTSDGSCMEISSSFVSMKGGKISKCSSPKDGGALRVSGTTQVTFENVVFEDNEADQGGSLLVSDLLNSNIKFTNCKFSGNKATSGGVFFTRADADGNLTFTQCQFINNAAIEFGGVFFAQDTSLTYFYDCLFEENTAQVGGAGYMDWKSEIDVHGCTFKNLNATSYGGSLYLDKSTKARVSSTTFQNSRSEASGGAVFLNDKASIFIENSGFTGNVALFSGGAIASSIGTDPKLELHNTIAKGNKALGDEGKGGFILFDQENGNAFIVQNLTCQDNMAAFGGCISLEDINYEPILNFIEYINNTATVFGENINTPPSQLEIGLSDTELLSGDKLPTFQVKLKNANGDFYYLPLSQKFFLVLLLENPNNLLAKVTGETQVEIEDGIANFPNTIGVVGQPGEYSLYIGPKKNDKVFKSSQFGKTFKLVINKCPSEGYSVEKDLSCKKIECSECKLGQGSCVSPGNCTCQADWEGLRCDLAPNFYDALEIFFENLPEVKSSKKRSDSQITVEMRDYLVSEITKSLQGNYTVEFRKLYQANNGYVLKVSIVKDGKYIEGSQLDDLKILISDYFIQNLNVETSLEKNEAIIQVMTFDNPFGVVVALLSFLMAAVTLCFAVMIIWFRHHPVIKASSPLFGILILVGILIAYLSFLPYMGEQTHFKCALQPLLTPLAFSLVFGNLFVKTFRIYRIFGNKRLQIVAPSNKTLLLYSGIIVSIDLAIVIIWLAIDAPKPVIDGPIGQRYWGCSSSNSTIGTIMTVILLIYNGALLAFGTFLAFATRNAFSAFRESQIIGFCIYTLTVVSICIFSVLYIPSLNLDTRFSLKTLGIIFVTTCIMILLFGSKLYLITKKNIDGLFSQDPSSSSGNGHTNGVMMSKRKGSKIVDDEEEVTGWLLVREESGLFSKWEKKYVYYAKDFFGIYDNDQMSSGIGSFPISKFSVARNEEDSFVFQLFLGERKFSVDAKNPEILKRWFNLLQDQTLKDRPSVMLEKSHVINELTETQ